MAIWLPERDVWARQPDVGSSLRIAHKYRQGCYHAACPTAGFRNIPSIEGVTLTTAPGATYPAVVRDHGELAWKGVSGTDHVLEFDDLIGLPNIQNNSPIATVIRFWYSGAEITTAHWICGTYSSSLGWGFWLNSSSDSYTFMWRFSTYRLEGPSAGAAETPGWRTFVFGWWDGKAVMYKDGNLYMSSLSESIGPSFDAGDFQILGVPNNSNSGSIELSMVANWVGGCAGKVLENGAALSANPWQVFE